MIRAIKIWWYKGQLRELELQLFLQEVTHSEYEKQVLIISNKIKAL